MIKLGEKIKKARIKARINQQALATITDVSQSIISRWENDVLIPDIPTLEKIANYTRTSISWFFEPENLEELKNNSRILPEKEQIKNQKKEKNATHEEYETHPESAIIEIPAPENFGERLSGMEAKDNLIAEKLDILINLVSQQVEDTKKLKKNMLQLNRDLKMLAESEDCEESEENNNENRENSNIK